MYSRFPSLHYIRHSSHIIASVRLIRIAALVHPRNQITNERTRAVLPFLSSLWYDAIQFTYSFSPCSVGSKSLRSWGAHVRHIVVAWLYSFISVAPSLPRQFSLSLYIYAPNSIICWYPTVLCFVPAKLAPYASRSSPDPCLCILEPGLCGPIDLILHLFAFCFCFGALILQPDQQWMSVVVLFPSTFGLRTNITHSPTFWQFPILFYFFMFWRQHSPKIGRTEFKVSSHWFSYLLMLYSMLFYSSLSSILLLYTFPAVDSGYVNRMTWSWSPNNN